MFERIMQVVCAVLLVGVILTSPISAQKSSYSECLADYPLLNFVIVLDAGHGGEDGGAIGIHTLVREKDINLSIVQKLGRLFESAGATVVLTRNNEDSLCTGKYSKMEDMQARAAVIEAANPYVVISVHCNSFPQSKNVKGAQMFYYPGSETGERLAECIQNSLRKHVDTSNKRMVKNEDFYMLRHGNSTNVMIECGFLSSPEEEKLLCDEAYQDMLAYAVFDGTCAYMADILTPQNH